MKLTTTFILLIIFSFTVFAQSSKEVLATANGENFTAADLSVEARKAYENLSQTIAERRRQLLDLQITNVLLELEAKEQKTNADKLFEKEVAAKIPAPSEEQIKAVYDANKSSIGNKTIEDIRPQIINFLRREPEQKLYAEYISKLRDKYKVTLVKDVAEENLKTFEVLAAVGGKNISVKDFEDANKIRLSDFEADLYHQLSHELEDAVYLKLLSVEAKSQKMEISDLIAREITNKLKDFSDEEREQLQNDFSKQLFRKYNAKFLLKEPQPLVLNISTENEPSQGKLNAPVTVVMFTDFQCPACSGVDPILKKVVLEYGDKVRLVVRDFPLVNLHENAFNAALAANAANAQGKFFVYKELLYKNQENLDKASLIKYAEQIGLNIEQFKLDLENKKFADEVRADMADGKSYGINATPTVFVNGVKVRELSAQDFRNAIEKVLK